MQMQEVNKDEWHKQFGQTLHEDPSDLWQEVLQEGDENGDEFDADEDK